jgi:zinc protease
MKALRIAAIILLAAASGPALAGRTVATAPAPAISVPPIGFTERTLPNGLRLVASRDPKAASAAVYVFYDVGQRDDPVQRGGFAHLFEHLMFKTTRNLPQGAQSYMTSIGVRANASTLWDFTIYNMSGPADQLERMLWLEGERMRNLVIDEPAYVSERNVVKEELRQRIFAQPYGRILYTLIPGFAFTTHPYARPIGGTAADLDRADLAEVRAFHEAYYRPDNAVVVVVGNFDPATLGRWADRHLGSIPRPTAAIPRDTRDEAPRTTPLEIDAYAPNVPLPALVFAWRAPAARDPDRSALALIEALLTSGPASRLNRDLVSEKRLASSITSYNLPARDGYSFALVVTLADGVKLPAAQAALEAEVAALRDTPIAQAELDRVRNAMFGGTLAGRETVDGRAYALGEAAILTGSAGSDDATIAAIRAMTPADLQRAAQRLLPADRRLAIRYQNESARPAGYVGDRSANAVDMMGTVVPAAQRAPVTIAADTDRAAPPPAGTATARAVPPILDGRLPNGLRLVTARSTELPLTTLELVIPGGDAADPADRAGLADVAAALALRGTGLTDALNGLGASLVATAQPDATTLRLSAPTANIDAAGRLLADAVLRPAVEPAELEGERKKQLAALQVMRKQPMQTGLRTLQQVTFAGTPYAALATSQSLGAITLDDVRAARSSWRPAGATLIVTGSLGSAEAEALASRLFGDWRGAATTPRRAALAAASAPRIVAVDLPGSGQTAVLAGYRLPPRSDASFRAVELASAVVGGGSQAWLAQEIRQKRGLSYGAGSEIMMRAQAGLLLAASQTKNESATEVVDLIQAQFARLGSEVPPPERLDERIRFLANNRSTQSERTAAFADYLAALVMTDTPLAVAKNELSGPIAVAGDGLGQATAMLAPANANIVVVGDSKIWIDALRARYPAVELVEAAAQDGTR